MTELKPCPCCDGKAELSKGYAAENVWQHGEFHRVYCTSCQLRQLFHRTPELAASAWNRRAASPADQVDSEEADLTPAEILSSRLIDTWCAAHGRQIPWAKAVEISAVVTKMPEAERARLLALDDAAMSATPPAAEE